MDEDEEEKKDDDKEEKKKDDDEVKKDDDNGLGQGGASTSGGNQGVEGEQEKEGDQGGDDGKSGEGSEQPQPQREHEKMDVDEEEEFDTDWFNVTGTRFSSLSLRQCSVTQPYDPDELSNETAMVLYTGEKERIETLDIYLARATYRTHMPFDDSVERNFIMSITEVAEDVTSDDLAASVNWECEVEGESQAPPDFGNDEILGDEQTSSEGQGNLSEEDDEEAENEEEYDNPNDDVSSIEDVQFTADFNPDTKEMEYASESEQVDYEASASFELFDETTVGETEVSFVPVLQDQSSVPSEPTSAVQEPQQSTAGPSDPAQQAS